MAGTADYAYFEGFCGIRPPSATQARGSSAEDGSGELLPPDLTRVAEKMGLDLSDVSTPIDASQA